MNAFMSEMQLQAHSWSTLRPCDLTTNQQCVMELTAHVSISYLCECPKITYIYVQVIETLLQS